MLIEPFELIELVEHNELPLVSNYRKTRISRSIVSNQINLLVSTTLGDGIF